MNPRIKQLAEQANGPNPFYGTLKNQMTLLGDDAVEKFAELILAECINIAEQTRFDGKVVAERIKFVFGVDQQDK